MNKYFLFATVMAISGCGDEVTLYRNSLVIPDERLKMATFKGDGLAQAGNRENCNRAATLFMSQPEVLTKFWCEG